MAAVLVLVVVGRAGGRGTRWGQQAWSAWRQRGTSGRARAGIRSDETLQLSSSFLNVVALQRSMLCATFAAVAFLCKSLKNSCAARALRILV